MNNVSHYSQVNITNPANSHRYLRLSEKMIALAIMLVLFSSFIYGEATLTRINHNDYEIINRTVIHLSDKVDYVVEQVPRNNIINITIDNVRRGTNVQTLQEITDSPILESIRVANLGGNQLRVTITTKMRCYIESFYLAEDNHRIVLDIFTKRNPETIEEKELFANFFTIVEFYQRAQVLLDEIEAAKASPSYRETRSTRTEQPLRQTSRSETGRHDIVDSDLISLSETVTFNDAMKIFNSIFRQKENRSLVNMADINETIGFSIDKIYWKAALMSILSHKKVNMTEFDDIYILKRDEIKVAPEDIKYIDDILIEVTFFEADFNVIKELGIDWSSIIDGRIRLSADLRSTDQLTQELLSIRTGHTFESGETTVDINTLFKAFSASDKGHIISRPQITVLSGETGSVQDGIDYTILVPGRTALGEEIAQAHEISVQSGTIVNITPTIILDGDGDKAIHLLARVEKSSAQPDVTGFSKKTSEINSQKLLYNGEETVIGGLTTQEKVSVRKGIPILKDLPWWVFGIRYLTGHSRSQVYNKELIILVKASILPDLQERKRARRNVAEDVDHHRKQFREIEPVFIR